MRKEYRFAISLASVLVLVTLFVVPEQMWHEMPSLCLWRATTNRECMGCGMTRALAAAAHGRWEAAMALNRGFLLAGPALLLGAAAALWRRS